MCQAALMISLIWKYYSDPVTVVPCKWIAPVERLVAFPTGVAGNLFIFLFYRNIIWKYYTRNIPLIVFLALLMKSLLLHLINIDINGTLLNRIPSIMKARINFMSVNNHVSKMLLTA